MLRLVQPRPGLCSLISPHHITSRPAHQGKVWYGTSKNHVCFFDNFISCVSVNPDPHSFRWVDLDEGEPIRLF
jgi:hypothetical protein